MTRKPRILYLNHDNPAPSGGVRVIYDHVNLLVRNGYNAFVVHCRGGFRPDWFEADVPILYCDAGFTLLPDDLLILPEDHAGFLDLFRNAPVRKVLFCQNHFYIYEGLKQHDTMQSLGISGGMACSDMVADFMQAHLKVPHVQTVHNAVAANYANAPRKKLQVACMPRKRPLEANFIRNACLSLLEATLPLEWVAIDAMPHDAVEQILGESALFLSLSRLEGFGLPPLEAMAKGCLVVGFTGFGGREYARPNNGLWCGEDDLVACAHALAKGVGMIVQGDTAVDILVANAMATAAQYTLERQERELLQALHYFLHLPGGSV